MRMFILALVAALYVEVQSETIIFGRGESSFEIEFVTIGNPGNPPDEPDHSGLEMGAVDYVYQIAKFELPCFAAERASRLGAGFNWFCSEERFARPFDASWNNAARLINWLNADAGFPEAYQFNELGQFRFWEPSDVGFDPDNPFRNSMSRYVLPTFDEWHKAAYYDPVTGVYFDYANGSDTLPVLSRVPTTDQLSAIYGLPVLDLSVDFMRAGGVSPYGIMGQTGNAEEWEEGFFFLDAVPPDPWAFRTGRQFDVTKMSAANSRQRFGTSGAGVRVVRLVPEPSSHLLGSFIGLILLRRRMK